MSIRKKALLITVLLLILILSSCNQTEVNNPSIPSISDNIQETSSSTNDDVDLFPPVDDEIAYHRSLGMTIIESYDDETFSKQYDLSTYDGLFALTVDSIYRTKLDIDILRSIGYHDGTFDKYYNIITAFLEEYEPTCLLPRFILPNSDNRLSVTWTSYITRMAGIDENSLVKNKALLSVYQYQCYRDSIGGANIQKRLAAYPLLSNEILGTPVMIQGQHYDEELNRTVIELSAENSSNLIYRYGRGEIKLMDTDVSIVSSNDKLYVSVGYAGDISVAAQNECGLIGETVYYTVKSELASIPSSTVSFASTRLDKAVRGFLGKSDSDLITMNELTAITDIYINGDTVVINREGLTVDQMNKSDPATNPDFSFSDIDYFPCLSSLTVKYNKTDNPSGNGVLGLEWLELTGCDITDISGLEGCSIKTLWLTNNSIKDASVLATATSIDNIMLADNPLTALSLPKKAISQINIQNTDISDLNFLETIFSLFSLNCRGTEVEDITPVCRLVSLQYLTLPQGVDYSCVANMSALRELTVGEEIIK